MRDVGLCVVHRASGLLQGKNCAELLWKHLILASSAEVLEN
jgi:hypothetical protein